jgi:hypothetical protein
MGSSNKGNNITTIELGDFYALPVAFFPELLVLSVTVPLSLSHSNSASGSGGLNSLQVPVTAVQ